MKEYSYLNATLLVNGNAITGFDEGDDVITLARVNDSASHKTGMDGDMTVSLSADHTGTCTFRLMQTSISNAYLSARIAEQESGAFTAIFVQFTDIKANDLISGTQGYITKPADVVRGVNANSQEWVIMLEKLVFIHGS